MFAKNLTCAGGEVAFTPSKVLYGRANGGKEGHMGGLGEGISKPRPSRADACSKQSVPFSKGRLSYVEGGAGATRIAAF